MALAGGPPQWLGDFQDAGVIRCARTANLCVVSDQDSKQMVLYALDPVKGKGRELWRIDRSLLRSTARSGTGAGTMTGISLRMVRA